jgi:tetratricopeptide (TPR) repeat protein
VPLDNPRIEELRRRVQTDPASIAFAQLAEEYRRAGSYDEAVRTCRTGLARHPGYLSARVTLGRALVELEALDDAQQELEFVLRAAPENLTAIRGVAEIHHRRGHMPQALEYYQRALSFARHDPELEETVEQIARELGGGPSEPAGGLSFEEAQSELISAIEGVPAQPAPAPPAADAAQPAPEPEDAPSPQASVYGSEADRAIDTGDADREPAVAPATSDDSLFDLEALLGALGEVPDRAAPAPIEALLAAPVEEAKATVDAGPSEPAPAAGQDPEPGLAGVTPGAPEASEPADSDDPLAALEALLRSHVPVAPEPGPEDAPAPTLPPMQQAIVDDLEQWLEQLVLARGDQSEPS